MAGWICLARCIFLPGLTGRFDLVLRGKLSANYANERELISFEIRLAHGYNHNLRQ